MFDYTRMIIEQTVTDVKRVLYGFQVGSQLIYISYLIYALITGTGIWYANATLLALACLYFIFFLSTTDYGKTPDGKVLKRKIKTGYVWSKRLIRLFTIGVAVYDIATADSTNSISTLLTALMIVSWALEVLLDLILRIIEARFELVKEAVEADVETLLKPFKTVGNFFKRATGQEIPPEEEPSKKRKWLDKKLSEKREKTLLKKQREQEEKRQKKEELSELKKQRKQSIKTENALLRKTKAKREVIDENDETDGVDTQ